MSQGKSNIQAECKEQQERSGTYFFPSGVVNSFHTVDASALCNRRNSLHPGTNTTSLTIKIAELGKTKETTSPLEETKILSEPHFGNYKQKKDK